LAAKRHILVQIILVLVNDFVEFVKIADPVDFIKVSIDFLLLVLVDFVALVVIEVVVAVVVVVVVVLISRSDLVSDANILIKHFKFESFIAFFVFIQIKKIMKHKNK
jgi:hypothetical protein